MSVTASRVDILLDLQAALRKHLPSEHVQATHGRRGAGGGNWIPDVIPLERVKDRHGHYVARLTGGDLSTGRFDRKFIDNAVEVRTSPADEKIRGVATGGKTGNLVAEFRLPAEDGVYERQVVRRNPHGGQVKDRAYYVVEGGVGRFLPFEEMSELDDEDRLFAKHGNKGEPGYRLKHPGLRAVATRERSTTSPRLQRTLDRVAAETPATDRAPMDQYDRDRLDPDSVAQIDRAYADVKADYPEVAEYLNHVYVDQPGLTPSNVVAYTSRNTSGEGTSITFNPDGVKRVREMREEDRRVSTIGDLPGREIETTMVHELAHVLHYRRINHDSRTKEGRNLILAAINTPASSEPWASMYGGSSRPEEVAEAFVATRLLRDKRPAEHVARWDAVVVRELGLPIDKRPSYLFRDQQPADVLARWDTVMERRRSGATKASGRVTKHPDPLTIYDTFGLEEELAKHGEPSQPGYRLKHPGSRAPRVLRGGRRERRALSLLAATGGFTYKPQTGRTPTSGYGVSIDPDRERVIADPENVTADDIRRYWDDNADLLSKPDKWLGGWLNDDDQLVLDVSTVVDDRERALALAKKNKQDAIYGFNERRAFDARDTEARKADSGGPAAGADRGRLRGLRSGDPPGREGAQGGEGQEDLTALRKRLVVLRALRDEVRKHGDKGDPGYRLLHPGTGGGGLPDLVRSWERSQPWRADRKSVERGEVEGISVGRARGSEEASYEAGRGIVVKPSYFDRSSDVRRAILYHEAGHGLESEVGSQGLAQLGVDDPLGIIDWPGAQALGGNYSEVLAEGYAALWTDPDWFDRQGASRIRTLITRMAKAKGYPTPAGPVAKHGNKGEPGYRLKHPGRERRKAPKIGVGYYPAKQPVGPKAKPYTQSSEATSLEALPESVAEEIRERVRTYSPGNLEQADIEANLEHVYADAVKNNPGAVEAGRVWYSEARDVADDFAEEFDAEPETTLGMIAATSPMMLWANNKTGVHFMLRKLTDGETGDALDEGYRRKHRIPEGVPIRDMDPDVGARAILGLTALESPGNGTFSPITGKEGAMAWSGGIDGIAKAIRIWKGERPDDVLSGHKVRSFYNNMADPAEPTHVTIDTHAVSAAVLQRLSGQSPTMKQLFNTGERKEQNISGTYALFADAYRKGAKRHGLLPNQYQAIVWMHWGQPGPDGAPPLSDRYPVAMWDQVKGIEKAPKKKKGVTKMARKRIALLDIEKNALPGGALEDAVEPDEEWQQAHRDLGLPVPPPSMDEYGYMPADRRSVAKRLAALLALKSAIAPEEVAKHGTKGTPRYRLLHPNAGRGGGGSKPGPKGRPGPKGGPKPEARSTTEIPDDVDTVDSLTRHTGPDGKLTPERQKLHDRIVADALAGHKPSKSPEALFLGGGPASGKSSVIKTMAGNDGALIDADAIKAHLPEYKAMLAKRDHRAAQYTHEESSTIAKKIQAAAAERRISYTLDGTGDSSIGKLASKVEQARAAGHTTRAVYVTTDVDEAIRRSDERGKKTGRVVPHSVIREIHAAVSQTFPQALERDLFDSVELYDTSTRPPRRVGHKPKGGTWTVEDKSAWERFLAKGTNVSKGGEVVNDDGDAAVRMAMAATAGKTFEQSGLPAKFKTRFDRIATEVKAIRQAGQVVEIPWEYTNEPRGEAAPKPKGKPMAKGTEAFDAEAWAAAVTLADAELLAKAAGITLEEARARLIAKGVGDKTSPAGEHKARHLIRWFERGAGAARIAWGTKGAWRRCVTIASEHMTPEQAKGFCNLRHKGATGKYPGEHRKSLEKRREALLMLKEQFSTEPVEKHGDPDDADYRRKHPNARLGRARPRRAARLPEGVGGPEEAAQRQRQYERRLAAAKTQDEVTAILDEMFADPRAGSGRVTRPKKKK